MSLMMLHNIRLNQPGRPIDYDKAERSALRLGILVLLSLAGGYAAGEIFYSSRWMAGVTALLALGFLEADRRSCIRRRKRQINVQFKFALSGISASLSAGKSVENAVRDAVHDLKWLYPDRGSDILAELARIETLLGNGETIESAFQDFGNRTGSEDIGSFAEVFRVCKRTGGDLVEIVRRTSGMIGDKVEMEQQIRILYAQKRFESMVMVAIAPILLAVLKWSSPDYMAPLYHGIGRLIMSSALLLFMVSAAFVHRMLRVRL